MRVRKLSFGDFFNHYHFDFDFNLFLSDGGDVSQILDVISLTKTKRSLLYITNDSFDKELMQGKANDHSKNSLFYLALPSGNKMQFYYVLTLNQRNRSVIESLKFYSNESKRVQEEYNLQAIPIRSISLPWFPFLTFNNCPADGKLCESSGLLDELSKIMAKEYNFTLISHKYHI